jgi:murein L,D-transpeptidase YcbB/YkuD
MHYHKQRTLFLALILLSLCTGCNDEKTKEKIITAEPVTVTTGVDVYIKNLLAKSQAGNGKVDDSLELPYYNALVHFYETVNFKPVWVDEEKWTSLSASLRDYLDTASHDGLFSADYQFEKLTAIRAALLDSVHRNKQLWAQADVLYTNAFMNILQDLKQGRMQADSLAWKNDTAKYSHFFTPTLQALIKEHTFSQLIASVQPVHPGYQKLKAGIKKFVDSMDKKEYTYIYYPYKKGDKPDSLAFIKKMQLRLGESGIGEKETPLPDSLQLSEAIKKYQRAKNLTADGKITASLVKALNATDVEKFRRIAITLDRFKQLPRQMPECYIWVNIPAFRLQVWDADSIVLESRIICGKTATPTPTLTSAVSDLVIYPTWTVPNSIITKEMLPGLKKNTAYLAKKGFNLINNKGEKIDPATVRWAGYSKGIPYQIQQGSGDDNALGVIKFNFNNPYSVYLHDTNQRYLFKNANRALSHGCVRVQEWEKLAYYIIRNDSVRLKKPDSIKYNVDSIKNWIAHKERHRITVKYQFPLFIRYFGCESINGTIKFYEDVYGDDKILGERFFSRKKI